MFLAASKARLWSPDPKSSLDTWADEQGELPTSTLRSGTPAIRTPCSAATWPIS